MKYLKKYEIIGSPDLIIAVKSEDPKKVKMLIDANYDVNIKDKMGWTPLIWAAYEANSEIIKMLIDAGADMHYKALHSIAGTKKMVDFYDLCVDKYNYEGYFIYLNTKEWIEKNYPEFMAAKKYNL